MIYINHRVNTLEQLKKLPIQNGAEIDVRYHEDELILHHDPFNHHKKKCLALESFLKNWSNKGPLILNIKTEGVEMKCIELMNSFNINNWFFLDLSMPYFARYSEKTQDNITGFTQENLAVRYSEREPIEYALSFKNKSKWVWVDCFTHFCLSDTDYEQLKEAKFKICLVSPELQGHPYSHINKHREQINNKQIDAVCTKRPDLWGQTLSNELITQLEKDFPIASA